MHTLAATMPEGTFRAYLDYAGTHLWPLQRLELQMQRMVWLLDCIRQPGQPLRLDDYAVPLTPRQGDPGDDDADDSAVERALDFKPRKVSTP
jgi:hypothetical protein